MRRECAEPVTISRETISIPVAPGEVLALHRIRAEDGLSREPVLLVHGAVENGRIFYSPTLKGFGPWLAREGYDVFVLDLRGRGESTPHVSRESTWGQLEVIEEDLPAAIETIERLTERPLRHWVAHSWGGVLLSSLLARRPELRSRVASLVYFATKRGVRVQNWDRWFRIDFGWRFLGPLVTWVLGFLPSRKMGWGSDDESRGTHREGRAWVAGPWIDPRDGFDYASALEGGPKHPKVLHLVGINDRCLGHRDDVRRFAEETGSEYELKVLSRESGQQLDYGHNDLLTSKEAVHDVYPLALEWMRRPS